MLFGSTVANQVHSLVARAEALEPFFEWRSTRDKGAISARRDEARSAVDKLATAEVTRPALSARQYLYQLNLEAKALTKSETLEAVVGVTSLEVRRVARLLACMRGRYLANLIDLGQMDRKTISEKELAQLRHAREQYEELERGFGELKAAIEAGEIELDGLKAD